MPEARLEQVYEDRVRAAEFLDQAERFRGDAATDGVSAEGQITLLHAATVAACDAILQASGYRVSGGDGGHVLRLREALARLEGDTEDLFEALDTSRARRNEASYTAGMVPGASVSDAREYTGELLVRASEYVSTRASA